MTIGEIIYCTMSSKEKIEKYQKIIRDVEWARIEHNIPEKSKFLDVGCGAGYSLMRASKDLNCAVEGIDADPGIHGVGRFIKDMVKTVPIRQGFAENLPYADESFDAVYCSHVLEHVNDEAKALAEMKRVLKKDGVLIIGMPTASMAILNYISQLIFTTHIKIYELFRNSFSKNFPSNFIKIFRINSHSFPRAQSIWYDIFHYKISNWKKSVSKQFKIVKIIKPCWYPYPDFPQFFKIHKNRFFSSSVFFICSKK
jgi:ubiquinone/menaquinone biosynthesis C-methylase UbiE